MSVLYILPSGLFASFCFFDSLVPLHSLFLRCTLRYLCTFLFPFVAFSSFFHVHHQFFVKRLWIRDRGYRHAPSPLHKDYAEWYFQKEAHRSGRRRETYSCVADQGTYSSREVLLQDHDEGSRRTFEAFGEVDVFQKSWPCPKRDEYWSGATDAAYVIVCRYYVHE